MQGLGFWAFWLSDIGRIGCRHLLQKPETRPVAEWRPGLAATLKDASRLQGVTRVWG